MPPARFLTAQGPGWARVTVSLLAIIASATHAEAGQVAPESVPGNSLEFLPGHNSAGAPGANGHDLQATDLGQLQGEWQLESARRDGKEMPSDMRRVFKCTIRGDKFVVTREAKPVEEGTLALCPTTKPKSIDFRLGNGKRVLGIYEVTAETYMQSYAPPGKDRPKDFIARQGSGESLSVWKRINEHVDDLKRSEGVWRITSITDDGRKVPENVAHSMTVGIAGNEYTVRVRGRVVERGTFVLDPSQTPKTIDVTVTQGQDKGKTALGIYKLDEKTRQVCLAQPGRPRPSKFESAPGSKWAFFVTRRETKDEAATQDLQQLQGEWRMQSMERDGKRVDDRLVRTFRRTVTRDQHIVTWEEGGIAQKLSTALMLDPTQNPKAVDVVITHGPLKGKRRLGIYKIEDDVETVCLAQPGKPRPTRFDSKQGAIHVWKRVKT